MSRHAHSEPQHSERELELVWHDAHHRGERLMVVLHGVAEHPAAALQLGSMLDPQRQFQICAPLGSIEVSDHKHAFYRSRSRMTPDRSSLAAARSGIDDAISAARESSGTEAADTVLVGVSQGAGLATIAALAKTETPRPKDLILFSSRPYPDDLIEWDLSAAAAQTRVFAAHGTNDKLSPIAEMREFLDRATNAGTDVTWRTHPYGHTLHADDVAAASRWLARPTQGVER